MLIVAGLHEQYATNSGPTVELHNTLSLSFDVWDRAVLAQWWKHIHGLPHSSTHLYTQGMQSCHVREYVAVLRVAES